MNGKTMLYIFLIGIFIFELYIIIQYIRVRRWRKGLQKRKADFEKERGIPLNIDNQIESILTSEVNIICCFFINLFWFILIYYLTFYYW